MITAPEARLTWPRHMRITHYPHHKKLDPKAHFRNIPKVHNSGIRIVLWLT